MAYFRFFAVLSVLSSMAMAVDPPTGRVCNLPVMAPPHAALTAKRTTSTGFAVGDPIQTTTRRAKLELSGETIPKDQLSFDGLVEHLQRHFAGTAGSQFNKEVFPDAQALAKTNYEALPDRLALDADGRVELTLPLSKDGKPVGWTGVVSLADLRAGGVPVRREARLPGGIHETLMAVYPTGGGAPNKLKVPPKEPTGWFEIENDRLTPSLLPRTKLRTVINLNDLPNFRGIHGYFGSRATRYAHLFGSRLWA